MVFVALALFCVWFLVDPDPTGVLREFVVGENFSRFQPQGVSYLSKLFFGGASIWALALGYPINAGLMAFPVVALFWTSFQRRREFTEAEKFLWILIVTLFLFFSIPSMRSSRYLLPAMPAVAVLCALNWERISRKVFLISLVLAGLTIVALSYLSLRLQFSLGSMHMFPVAYWLLLGFTAALVLVALFVPEFTRPAVPGVALLLCLSLAVALRPLDGPLGRYSPDAQQYVSGKQVWVPCNFRAVDEGYRFLLPGADVHGYRDDKSLTPDSLDTRYAMFAIRQPLTAAVEPSGLRLIGQRLELRSRHNKNDLLGMLRGNVFNQLFLREILVEVPGAQPVAHPVDDGCR
jgi:4-amino-4-deoxy-L-arabinose transferase-like glycosyltransferase